MEKKSSLNKQNTKLKRHGVLIIGAIFLSSLVSKENIFNFHKF